MKLSSKIFILNYLRLNIFLLLALALAGLAQFRWISFSVFQYGDWRFHFSEVGSAFMEFSPWTTSFSLGQGNYALWKLPFNFVYGIFGNLGVNSNISEKFLVFWPAIFLPPLASFFLVSKVVRSNPAALAGSLIYSLNSYFFSINSVGHVFITIAAAWGVMTIWIFIIALAKRHVKYYILTALMACLTVTYDLRIALILIFVLTIFWFYHIATNRHKRKTFKGTISCVVMINVFILFLNSYWLLPELASNLISINDILKRSLFGNQFFSILNSIALAHPFWADGKPQWFLVQPIKLYFFILPLLAICGLLLNKRNKEVIFFGLLLLIGVFLSKQSGVPFTQFYLLLFTNLPGFSAFREASKFYFLIAISYGVLTGALIAWLYKHQSSDTYKIFLKYLVWVLIFILTAWNVKPLITGEVETMYVKRSVPDDYIQLHQYLLADKEFSRVLWIPTDVPWEVNTVTHPTISIAGLLENEWSSHVPTLPTVDKIDKLLGLNFFNNLISNSSIRYIVVPLRDVSNDGDFYKYYGGSVNTFIEKLDKLAYLRKLNIGMSQATIYENLSFRPHLYLTENVDSIFFTDTSFRSVDFFASQNSEFHFSISNLSSVVYLQFTDSYNPNWQLNYGSFRWWNIFGDDFKSKQDLNHIKTDSGLSVFRIDPLYIKQNFSKTSYKDNLDGSIDVDITLYFRSQAYLNIGLIISFLSLIGCISYLLINSFGRGKNCQLFI